MRYITLAAFFILVLASTANALTQRSLLNSIMAQEQTDPGAAFAAAMSLAVGGYAPALDRVGYHFRHGIGTQKDLAAARDWYLRAIAAGHPWSTATLARVEIEMGHGDAALRRLEVAARQNLPGTQRLLATSHIDRHFGVRSDPALGRAMLETLAADGEKNAARDLIMRLNWGRLIGPASARAVAQVVQAGLAGDARFAEAALVYLARRGDTSSQSLQTRVALARIPGMRERVLSTERIHLAALTHPRQFWSKVDEALADTDAPNYARAASAAFWINKNAWVRVLQNELRSLGYYSGQANGQMTSRTIRAQNRFCRDVGIWATCATGPLRGATVRAVADAIATRR